MSLLGASLRHYRGLHALVVAGVAVAVAVLAGALLVGSSVRQSLRELAVARLGSTEIVVSSTTFVREGLADGTERRADSRRRATAGRHRVDHARGQPAHRESRVRVRNRRALPRLSIAAG